MPTATFLSSLLQALELAAEEHRLQRRSGYDRLPYINHLIKVCRVLQEHVPEVDENTLLAAALHDIIEDTDITEADLAARFNPQVAAIVTELSDDMSLPDAQRKQLQLDRAPQLSRSARMIRIADKGSNILDILQYPVAWPLEKKQRYLKHAMQIADLVGDVPPALTAWFGDVTRRAWTQLRLEGPYPLG